MRQRAFTLIELLVVMSIIATLLSLAVPRYIGHVEMTKEAVLRENLASLRDVLDKHFSDTGKYPMTLDELVSRRYLRKIPVDPLTDSNHSWVLVAPPDRKQGGIFDVRSGAKGKASDGSAYRDW